MSGRAVTLGFSLGDPRDGTMARMKEQHRAAHLGLLVVLNDPDSLEEVNAVISSGCVADADLAERRYRDQ